MMETDMAGLLVDGALLLILGAVLFSCIRLDRRLKEVRGGQADLADLVQRLEGVTGKAREAISALKAEAESVETDLRSEIRRGRGLADELILITEAGDNLASRLEHKLTPARDADRGGEPRTAMLHALKEVR